VFCGLNYKVVQIWPGLMRLVYTQISPGHIWTTLYLWEIFQIHIHRASKNWIFALYPNEITETSGRLHPLWPQSKWLHTPWAADYRHTRQDRWIQTEMAFTRAKNATKPNPFEIIPIQTTRKENNWKTEEALARAAVTLETERIKGSNPWCLWWWWWWYQNLHISCIR